MSKSDFRSQPTTNTMPSGVIDFVAREPCHVGETYVRTGDVVSLVDGPHTAVVAVALSAPAQRREHGRVILEQTRDGAALARRPGARMVLLMAGDVLPVVPALTGTAP